VGHIARRQWKRPIRAAVRTGSVLALTSLAACIALRGRGEQSPPQPRGYLAAVAVRAGRGAVELSNAEKRALARVIVRYARTAMACHDGDRFGDTIAASGEGIGDVYQRM